MAPVSIAKRPVGADCNCGRRIIQIRKSAYLGSCDKKVSGTFCEELALRVLRTKGTRHLLIAHCLPPVLGVPWREVLSPATTRPVSRIAFSVRDTRSTTSAR